MTQPKVSVIVAAYNQEKYIGRCLRSLINQNMLKHEYEIIVINDGSTDRTDYALSQFVDPKNSLVKVINNEFNMGLPAALNKGINMSSAPYIVRVDSDDFVNNNFINILYYYLDSNPDCDAVACDYFLVDDVENIIERRDSKNMPIACGIMFRKKHLIEIGLYDEEFRMQEDVDLKIRFEKKYRIHNIRFPLYRYRMHDSNITKNIEKMDSYFEKIKMKHGSDI